MQGTMGGEMVEVGGNSASRERKELRGLERVARRLVLALQLVVRRAKLCVVEPLGHAAVHRRRRVAASAAARKARFGLCILMHNLLLSEATLWRNGCAVPPGDG